MITLNTLNLNILVIARAQLIKINITLSFYNLSKLLCISDAIKLYFTNRIVNAWHFLKKTATVGEKTTKL